MTPSLSIRSARAAPRLGGFTLKLFVALGLVALADVVFGGGGRFGSASAAFGAAWLVGLWAAQPAMRHGGALVAYAFAWAMAVVLFEDPNGLAAVLFWGGLTAAALAPRLAPGQDLRRWATGVGSGIVGPAASPVLDVAAFLKARKRAQGASFARIAATLAMPMIGTAVFAFLFAQANPIISDWLTRYRSDAPVLNVPRIAFWIAVAALVWASLRQRGVYASAAPRKPSAAPSVWPGASALSILLSLILFNLLFALENALDIAFLWSGAALPDGVTLADYAHRGAYPLIATALLAGAFVLVFLRPGASGADNPAIRKLVYLWIAQNILLVASSALRTVDYVEAYSLTRLRLAALIWMALVAFGLAMICWRIWKAKSGAWLVGANALALVATLSVCATVDLGEVTARWNARHAEEIERRSAQIDMAYLEWLGPSALGALTELRTRSNDPGLRWMAGKAEERVMAKLAARQSDWRSWSWRGARRLAAAQAAAEAEARPSETTTN